MSPEVWLEFFLQKAHQARPQKPGIAGRLVDWVRHPVMGRVWHDSGPNVEPRLFQRRHKGLGLGMRVGNVVGSAPDHQESGVVVVQGGIGQWRGFVEQLLALRNRDAVSMAAGANQLDFE